MYDDTTVVCSTGESAQTVALVGKIYLSWLVIIISFLIQSATDLQPGSPVPWIGEYRVVSISSVTEKNISGSVYDQQWGRYQINERAVELLKLKLFLVMTYRIVRFRQFG